MPGINDNEFNLVGGLTDDFLEDKLVSPLPSILAAGSELSLDADRLGEALTPEPFVEGEDEFPQMVLEKGNLLDKEVIVSSTPDNSDSDSLTNYRQDDEVTSLIDIDEDDPLINGGDVSSEGSLSEEPSESDTEESDRLSDNPSESSESDNSDRKTLAEDRDEFLEAEPPTLETDDEAIALDNGGAVSEEESHSEEPSNSNTEEIEGLDNPSESSESDKSDRKTLAEDRDESSEAEPLELETNDEAIALDNSPHLISDEETPASDTNSLKSSLSDVPNEDSGESALSSAVTASSGETDIDVEVEDTKENTEADIKENPESKSLLNSDRETDSDSENNNETSITDATASSDGDDSNLPKNLENFANVTFDSGVFVVGESGKVQFDYLFDGGGYEGKLAAFSLTGMEPFQQQGLEAFIQEALRRSLSQSLEGHVVISDRTEGARFSGELGEANQNRGDYQGIKTLDMTPGDKFGVLLVPQGTLQEVWEQLEAGNFESVSAAKRPLFSMSTANPEDGFNFGQIADVFGDGSTFVFEDLRVDKGTDLDYNDVIFQVRGAIAEAAFLKDVINPNKNWLETGELSKAIENYAKREVDDSTEEETEPQTPIAETLPDSVKYALLRSQDLENYDPKALETTRQWVVGVTPGYSASEFATLYNAEDIGATGHIPDTYIWNFSEFGNAQQVAKRLSDLKGVEFAYPLTRVQLEPLSTPNDPLFNQQWHLENTGQTGGTAGVDANIITVWDEITGEGIKIAIVDDGVQHTHPDLSDRYRPDLSLDLNEGDILHRNYDTDPAPFSHQTIASNFANPQPLIDNDWSWELPTLDVGLKGVIDHAKLKFNFDHPAPNELDIYLYSPKGTDLLLPPITTSGEFEIDTALFNGEEANGEWRLMFEDRVLGNSGTLNNWSLELQASNKHGTSVAGVAVGTSNNNLGISGIAPNAEWGGIRLIADKVTDIQIADALYSNLNQSIQVYNNSWKPPAFWFGEQGQGLMALHQGVTTGRGDLGNIYLFGAGNDGENVENINYNAYANSRYTIAVGAVDSRGRKPLYSQEGAALFVSAPSSGNTGGITTTDLLGDHGWNSEGSGKFGLNYTDLDYTNDFGGTSSATPVVSGVVALMLEANPNLTWRDVQHILAETANRNAIADSSANWSGNDGDRIRHSDRYGFGLVDAASAVAAASTWTSVAPEVAITSGTLTVDRAIPDNTFAGITQEFTLDRNITLESVEVVFDADHPYRGDLWIELTAPDGTKSLLANPSNDDGHDYQNWVFNSVRHWGDSSQGTWQLRVRDRYPSYSGSWNSWKLNFYGTQPTVTLEASDTNASETGDAGEYTFIRTGDITHPLTVSYAIAGSATNTIDYTELTGSITIPAGSDRITLPLSAIDDEEVEGTETVVLTLAAGSAYNVGTQNMGTVEIADNDLPNVPPTLTPQTATQTYTEDIPLDLIDLVVSDPDAGDTLTVELQLDPTAGILTTGTVDGISSVYNSATGLWQVSGDVTTVNAVLADVRFIPTENYYGEVTIATSVTDNIAPAVTGAIALSGTPVNDAPALSQITTLSGATQGLPFTISYEDLLNASDASDVEGDAITFQIAGITSGTFTKNGQSVTVGETELAAGESLIWYPDTMGNAVPAFAVTAFDGVDESQNAVNVAIAVDELPTIIINATDAIASESGDRGQFTILRSGNTDNQLTVNLAASGNAVNGSDYSAIPNSITIPAGQSSIAIDITAIDDSLVEGDEQVILTLSVGSDYQIGGQNSATVTIVDNDNEPLPMVMLAPGNLNASESGVAGNLLVFRNNGLGQELTVNYSLGGTAENGVDYQPLTGSVTIDANSFFATIQIIPIDDSEFEGTETVSVNLVAGAGYQVSPNGYEVQIADNDKPSVSLVATDGEASEDGDLGYMTLTRTGITTNPLTVNYAIGGTATNGMDYTALSGSIEIPAGLSSITIPIQAIDDNSVEGDETVVLTLTDNSAYNVGTDKTATVSIIENDLEPFTPVESILTGVDNGSVAWGDYDGDGDLDLLITGRRGMSRFSKIYQNNGSGNFIDIDAGLIGVDNGSVAWGDYDGDGDLDILLTGDSNGNSNGIAKIYRNDGGNFIDIAANLPGVVNSSVEWGDYDNDGDLDILLTGHHFSSGGYGSGGYGGVDVGTISQIYRNDDGTFIESGISLIGVGSGSAAWGDYDRDGDLDIVLTGITDDGSSIVGVSKIYRNDSGSFTDIGAMLPEISWSSAAWGDYDNDGDLDLVITGFNDTVGEVSQLYQNNEGTFIQVETNLPGITDSAVAWGDYDNDGDLDILLVGQKESSNSVATIYRNDGDNEFTDIDANLKLMPPNVYNTGDRFAVWGDYDRDGNLDILQTGLDSSNNFIAQIYRNNSVIANNSPTSPDGLNALVHENSVTLSWEPGTDSETPQNGLTYNLRVGTTPGASDIVSPMSNSDGTRQLAQMGNVHQNTNWTINNLKPGTYYWSVQAVDSAFAGSEFATEGTFTMTAIGEIQWIQQIGTASFDDSREVAADKWGNVYITGYTLGSLGGTNAGNHDAILTKYDTNGNLLWTRQLGTPEVDVAFGVATDSVGNVYITGQTAGALEGTNAGNDDAFVTKYDTNGDLLWTRQLGTPGVDIAYGVATDHDDNFYITGYTTGSLASPNAGEYDAFIAKYDSNGNQLWSQQLGSLQTDIARGVAIDGGGNVYISGRTTGSLDGNNAGNFDAFFAKYDRDGNLVWIRQLGTSGWDQSPGISTDKNGNIYITGYTTGNLEGVNAGTRDIFVTKYDPSGNLLWTEQLGTSSLDYSYGSATDSAGNVYITGHTTGSLEGENSGGYDVFAIKLDSNGNQVWIQQFGTSAIDYSRGIATDPAGNIYITGSTQGSFGQTTAGNSDVWVAKLS
ncbi:SBBP repeat-containing protein [Oscillatoria acuminata]|uniref:Regulatory P domain of subtilisin-like proprotein convertases n=1 Tax=Oscillatoria acuminata PCC 6304 TaxID=56110 RepID=K9THS9_9CYAN|nr:SBBP repeat-containing protein [Oscillatoria acuminata]AFY82417.1 regulatory P domain of subtilisin-like proprotein convertases [Oscillatoria acuminata PCC 6304]